MPAHHGILNPLAGAPRYTIGRYPPCPALAPFVDYYWIIRWHVDEPYAQETLPHPCVHLAIGDHQAGVHGPAIARFVANLTGAGSVLGVRFHPGGFHPFYGRDIAELAGRTCTLAAIFGAAASALEVADPSRAPLGSSRAPLGSSLAATDPSRAPSPAISGPSLAAPAALDAAWIAPVEAFLTALEPAPDPGIALATRAVALAHADPHVARTAELAERVELSPRSLERLFRRYVGVSPKWVIRRFRIHEACERAKTGVAPGWAALATELGYFDQAHFIRDFKAQVGRTPSEYAALCGDAHTS